MNTKTYLISIKTNSINKKIINTIIDLINIKKQLNIKTTIDI